MKSSEIKAALYNWAVSALPDTNWSVVFANQNAPSPNRPYVTLRLFARQDIGEPYFEAPDEYGVAVWGKDREASISVQVFGENQGDMDVTEDLFDSLHKETVRTFMLRAGGLVFVRHLTGITDLSGLMGNGIEPREQFDIRVRTAVVIEDDVGLIERVELTTVFKGEAGETVYQAVDTIGD